MSLDHLYDFFSESNDKDIQEHEQEETKSTQPILTARNELNEKSKVVYEELSENIRISEELRREITKGIKNNRSIDDLLKDSLKCISLMTNDKIFYKQNVEKLEDRA